jgi:hypothetical protein
MSTTSKFMNAVHKISPLANCRFHPRASNQQYWDEHDVSNTSIQFKRFQHSPLDESKSAKNGPVLGEMQHQPMIKK